LVQTACMDIESSYRERIFIARDAQNTQTRDDDTYHDSYWHRSIHAAAWPGWMLDA
jgi:hypothetical protein